MFKSLKWNIYQNGKYYCIRKRDLPFFFKWTYADLHSPKYDWWWDEEILDWFLTESLEKILKVYNERVTKKIPPGQTMNNIQEYGFSRIE